MIPMYSYNIITYDIYQVFDYAQKYDGFVDRLLRHLSTSAMMDLLLQMVVAPDSNQIRMDLAQVNICDVPSSITYHLHAVHVHILVTVTQ